MVEGHNAARGQVIGRTSAEQNPELHDEAADPAGDGQLSQGEGDE